MVNHLFYLLNPAPAVVSFRAAAAACLPFWGCGLSAVYEIDHLETGPLFRSFLITFPCRFLCVVPGGGGSMLLCWHKDIEVALGFCNILITVLAGGVGLLVLFQSVNWKGLELPMFPPLVGLAVFACWSREKSDVYL